MKLSSILLLLAGLESLWGWGSRNSLSLHARVPTRARLFTLFATETESTNQGKCGDTCEPQNCASTGDSSSFLLNLAAPISREELTDLNLVKIVNLECSDNQCNQICWKCLGYAYDPIDQTFKLSDKVFPKWAAKYPVPPDVIGVTRDYSDPAVDRPVRDASMDLMRSVPRDFKGGVKSLVSVGFKMYKLNELTPNKTRRAQLVNWLLFYRERLFGRTIEQLQAEAAERKRLAEMSSATDTSPSEMMYQRKRLDTVSAANEQLTDTQHE